VHEGSDRSTLRHHYFLDTNLVAQYFREANDRLAEAAVAYAVTLRAAVSEVVKRVAADRSALGLSAEARARGFAGSSPDDAHEALVRDLRARGVQVSGGHW
jgi:hypothetical protein